VVNKIIHIFVPTKKNTMGYLSIKNFEEEEQQEVLTTLTMVDIKMLHNAMVDILYQYPHMSGYRILKEKLEKIILLEIYKKGTEKLNNLEF
jgi:hypothetical protein